MSGDERCNEGTHLDPVHKLGDRNILLVSENVHRLECTGAVLDLESQKVSRVGRRTGSELDSEGGPEVGCGCITRLAMKTSCAEDSLRLTHALELWVLLDDLELVEERDEGVVRRLHQNELQGVLRGGESLEGAQNGVQQSTTGDCKQRPSV